MPYTGDTCLRWAVPCCDESSLTRKRVTVLYVLSYHAPDIDDNGDECVGAFPISSPRELSRRLEQLTAQAIWREDPMMVHLTDEDLLDGPLLSIGLGAVHSCADWHANSITARWTTNTPNAATTGLTRFSHADTPRLMPAHAMITLDDAWQAMDDFWTRSGQRPQRLRWRLS